MDRIIERGRWSDARTARIYIHDGHQTIQQVAFTPQSLQLLQFFITLLHTPF